jgi:hypothetical protein
MAFDYVIVKPLQVSIQGIVVVIVDPIAPNETGICYASGLDPGPILPDKFNDVVIISVVEFD